MQTPTASDPSFKAFLEKLQEQNNRGFVTQLVQLKAEREIAGEDGDKREEQLDQANDNLKNLKDETTSVGDNLKSSLQDLSDDIIEVQDQLDTANDSLSQIATAIIGARESIEGEMLAALEGVREAVTGIKLDIDFSELKAAIENVGYDVGKDIDSGGLVATISAVGMNTTKLLDEQLKELSLTRKLTEGSVEYDKEAAQYRNKSGRDVESKVSGKTSKDGGFIDFETARDTLSGQGERAKNENKVSLITGVTTTRSGIRPGDATAKSIGADLGSFGAVDAAEPVAKTPEVVPGKLTEISPEVTPGRNTSIKRARRERGSVTGDVDPKKEEGEELDRSLLGRIKDSAKFFMTDGLSEKDSKDVVKKERETKVSSPRQENPEADNFSSTGEIQADAAKSDLELSKQMLDTTREQLTVLREIRDALAPKTPGELSQGGPKGKDTPAEKEKEEGGGSSLGDLASGAMDLMGKKGGVGKVAGIGSKMAKFATSNTGKVLGSAAAVGLGAYTAYKGVTAAEDSKQAKMEEVQAKVDSGEMKPEEAAAARKEIGNTATVEKSGAVGEGTGMAAGAIAGAKLGATVGTFVGGPIGTAVGGLAGGALGAFAGSKGGKVVGEYGGKAINATKDFFGFGDKKKPEAVSPSTETTTSTTSESGSDDDSIYSRTIMKLKGYDPDAPDEVKAFKRLTADNRPLTSIPNIVSGSATGSTLGDIDQVFATKSKNNITGSEVAKTSTENADMAREASGKGGANNTVVSNNVSSNNTTKIVPMKANPRPEYTGSALDRYTSRIAVY